MPGISQQYWSLSETNTGIGEDAYMRPKRCHHLALSFEHEWIATCPKQGERRVWVKDFHPSVKPRQRIKPSAP
jgi:hypothetical protein